MLPENCTGSSLVQILRTTSANEIATERWSDISGPIPWFSPSQISLASQIAAWSHVHQKTCGDIQRVPHSISVELYFDFSITDHQWRVIFNFLRASFARDLVDTGPCGHLIGQNYLGWREPTNGPKIPDHTFRGHFVSGSGGMGTRLHSVLVGLQLCKKHVWACGAEWANILAAQRLAIPQQPA